MPSISTLGKPITHDALDGISVLSLTGDCEAGNRQRVLVTMEPNSVVPLHIHRSAAKMTIVAGKAVVLSEDGTNGQLVKSGNVVFFESNAPHGFLAGEEGMIFISENDGIVDDGDQEKWDMELV